MKLETMKPSHIKRVAVIGSGIMGHGIGQTFALGGYEVQLNDISDELLDKALHQIRNNLETFIESLQKQFTGTWLPTSPDSWTAAKW